MIKPGFLLRIAKNRQKTQNTLKITHKIQDKFKIAVRIRINFVEKRTAFPILDCKTNGGFILPM